MNPKIKVVWICHFSNESIQKKLGIQKRISEFAPWISLSIEEIKRRDDIILHIISPYRWLHKTIEFVEENIHYHFFNPGIPIYGRHWPSFFRFDILTSYYFNSIKIKKIIKKINPDIINLHGIENPYYSSSIFHLKSYPILITIQGLRSLRYHKSNNKKLKKSIQLEQRILAEFTNFGIRVKILQQYISSMNIKAKFYWYKYPFKSLINSSNATVKSYDCVFFARVSKEKGIEDLIDAISIVKQTMPNVSVKVIGNCSMKYQKFLQEKIVNKNLNSNIKILGFIPSHSKVHKLVSQARLTVLPTYNDILPGTIIESLKIGIPVISYAANGVVDFNDNQEVIRLVKLGDINALANEIVNLLNSPRERDKLMINGLKLSKKEFSNTDEVNKLVIAYKKIIQNDVTGDRYE